MTTLMSTTPLGGGSDPDLGVFPEGLAPVTVVPGHGPAFTPDAGTPR